MQAGKHPQAIATKLLPPRCVGLIERPRLVEFVTEVQSRRLSVVKAPAGFGKTSLAAEWVERLSQSGNLVAWFSIDVNDNQPTQFLFYLSHALQHAHDGVGSPAIDLILADSSDQQVTTDPWRLALIKPSPFAAKLIETGAVQGVRRARARRAIRGGAGLAATAPGRSVTGDFHH